LRSFSPRMPVRLRRTGQFLAKHWRKWVYAFVLLLLAIVKWAAKAIGEDRVVNWLESLIEVHRNAAFHAALWVALILLRYPLLIFTVVACSIVLHAYLVSNRSNVNLACDNVGFTMIVRDGEVFRRAAMTPGPHAGHQFGWIVHISNLADPEKNVVGAGRVKAQMTLHINNNSSQIISPGIWIDEPCSSTTLDPGDTRYLLLMFGLDFTERWLLMVNRRGRLEDPVAFDYAFELWPSSRGTIEVRLFTTESSETLKVFEVTWRWEYQYHPQVISLA
jgi:hypothetical protein